MGRLPQPAIARHRSDHSTGFRPAGNKPDRRLDSTLHYPSLVRPRHPHADLEDELEASGRFAVTKAGGSSGVLFGWFNENSHGWRTPNSLAFRLDGNGGKYWVLFEYGTHNWLTGGTGCFEGAQYQKTPTKPFLADGTVHKWTLRYLPGAASGQGEVRFILDHKEYVCPLAPGHKADGATFNRFGVFNHQTTGKGMEVCFSELFLKGTPLEQDAQWEGKGNHVRFEDRVFRPLHDFGYFPPSTTNGNRGQMGESSGETRKPRIMQTGLGD